MYVLVRDGQVLGAIITGVDDAVDAAARRGVRLGGFGQAAVLADGKAGQGAVAGGIAGFVGAVEQLRFRVESDPAGHRAAGLQF